MIPILACGQNMGPSFDRWAPWVWLIGIAVAKPLGHFLIVSSLKCRSVTGSPLSLGALIASTLIRVVAGAISMALSAIGCYYVASNDGEYAVIGISAFFAMVIFYRQWIWRRLLNKLCIEGSRLRSGFVIGALVFDFAFDFGLVVAVESAVTSIWIISGLILVAVVVAYIADRSPHAMLRCWDLSYCPDCEVNLTGNVSGVCPECGRVMP